MGGWANNKVDIIFATCDSMTPFINFTMKAKPKAILRFSSGGKDLICSLFLCGGRRKRGSQPQFFSALTINMARIRKRRYNHTHSICVMCVEH